MNRKIKRFICSFVHLPTIVCMQKIQNEYPLWHVLTSKMLQMQKRSRKLFLLIYIRSNRARRADSEYLLFIGFASSCGFEILKILKTVQKVNNWSFSKKFKVSLLCTHCTHSNKMCRIYSAGQNYNNKDFFVF